jgi:hypothetical protein
VSTSQVLLSTSQYVRVNTGLNPLILQAHRDAVRIVISDAQPARSNSVFHLLSGREEAPFKIPFIDKNVWALAMTDSSSLIVTEIPAPPPKDFFIEVAKGNVPGHTQKAIVARSRDLSTTPLEIWGKPDNMIYPTTGETWEAVSQSPNDTFGGSGANVLVINSLDVNFVQQTEVILMNGVTPVPLVGTHYRPDGALVGLSGASMTNEGDIDIRQISTGNVRQVVQAGFSASQDTQYTTPAGKGSMIVRASPYYPKNESGNFSARVGAFGTNTQYVAGDFATYQNTFDIEFETPFILGEKSDIVYQLTSDNEGPIVMNLVFEMVIFEL